MKNARRKKKQRPNKKLDDTKQQQAKRTVLECEEESAKCTVLESLVEAFSLSSMEEASIAYAEAGGDPDKASAILMKGSAESNAEDPSSCSSTTYSSSCSGVSGSDVGSSRSGSSSLGSSEEFLEFFGGRNQKRKVVAATGTVSTVLGKGYVGRNCNRNKGSVGDGMIVEKEEAEQFLCSMLGKDSDLNLAVVRDVLCQCGYNIERALDIMLDLTASTNEQSRNDRHPDFRVDNIDAMRFFDDHNDNLIDRRSECASLSSYGELSDNFWSQGTYRNYADVLTSSKANNPISPGCTKYDLPQKVLESLFNIPKSSKHDKGTMNWRNVVQKMQSLGPGFDVSPHIAECQQPAYAKGVEYHMFREDAKQHWDTTKSYFQKAASAYTKGDQAYAAYLSDQGKEKTKLAQRADTKASQDIFIARNKDIENMITIDLHGQHVKPAMRILKLHLLFGSYVPSVQTLRVITGCGSHGVGKSKLKQSVIKLLEKEAMDWCEENRGTVLIKLGGWREFSFLDSDSDSDRCTKYDLPQKVLESLFNIPKSSEHDKGTMNWRNVVQKMQSLGPGFDVSPHIAECQQPAYAKGVEYHMFREDAKQHWDTTKSYFQKAASAYTKGDQAYAAYLSDQGKEKTKLAQRADTKASQDIFIARNKDIENMITIDLHGQHVKPAMRILKLHLLFGSYVPSVQTLRVITGCGSHGVGKSKLKQSVIKLLEKEAMDWCEENRGTVLIKLGGWREFSFLDSDSDSDSN